MNAALPIPISVDSSSVSSVSFPSSPSPTHTCRGLAPSPSVSSPSPDFFLIRFIRVFTLGLVAICGFAPSLSFVVTSMHSQHSVLTPNGSNVSPPHVRNNEYTRSTHSSQPC